MSWAKTSPRVAVIVLNWNGWRDTVECLESLQQIRYPDYQIIVVDNGSTDGSVQKIQAWARGDLPVVSAFVAYRRAIKPVVGISYDRAVAEHGGLDPTEAILNGLPPSRRLVLVQTGANLGFSAGNNVALRYALKREFPLMLLLNNDTVVEPDFLSKLVQTLETDPRIVAVGPKILYKERPEAIWYAGAQLKLWRLTTRNIGIDQIDSNSWKGTHLTDQLSGCCFLARRELFERLGLLDEDYFFGHEDAAYSCSIRRAGLLLAVNLDAVIYHKRGGSSESNGPIHVYYYCKNRLLVLKKQGSALEKILGLCFFTVSRPLKWTLLLLRGRCEVVAAELRAIRDFTLGRYGEFDRFEADRRSRSQRQS
ncbi:MAG TPA: glycosyltransferase family 2 protein [Alphaproteobacteria bacterium]|nr:glycosyltransferase family 2 protein [Alphaproteobacteria bacterium]